MAAYGGDSYAEDSKELEVLKSVRYSFGMLL